MRVYYASISTPAFGNVRNANNTDLITKSELFDLCSRKDIKHVVF